MHVAKIIGPFGQSAGWQSFGWNLKPNTPRLAGKIVFLTDGRAISYAESVMGYVADRKLGTIVGSTTAGTNGNIATFPVPVASLSPSQACASQDTTVGRPITSSASSQISPSCRRSPRSGLDATRCWTEHLR